MLKHIILGLLVSISLVFADDTDQRISIKKPEILAARIILPAQELARQNSYTILIELNISDEWHINSNQPLEDFLIPTQINFSETEGITFGKINFQQPKLAKFSFSDTRVSVFEKKSYARTTITINPDFAAEEVVLRANIEYQACNDESCLAPTTIDVSKLVEIADAGAIEKPVNEDLFKRVESLFDVPGDSSDASLGQVLRTSGIFYALFFIYLGGLALNLTPCVYPLIPITISYFGGQSGGNKQALIGRAVLYVIGMAVTYSFLGVIAALTGGLLGSALQNPFVLVLVALVLIGLALSMFGVYEIRVPQSLALIGGKNRSGYLGTFLMGLTVGLIAAPCIGPFVLGLLTYVGELGDPVLGFWMFFVLAIGLGTPFLLLGIFSGAVTSLPRSGAWMVWVRILFGFVLVGMAIYFLEPLFPVKSIYYYSMALLAVVAGVYLAWLDKNTGKTGFKIVRNLVGIAFIILGIFIAWPADTQARDGIVWKEYSKEFLDEAKQKQIPVMIDFYADWCIPCKELDAFTFSDQRVVAATQNFMNLKADLTSFQSEETIALREDFDIKGVPTIVFLSAQGTEVTSMRLIGFENADKFLDRLKQIE